MRRFAIALLATAVVAPSSGAMAASGPTGDVVLVRRGVTHALQQHWLKAKDAQRYRNDVAVAVRDLRALPPLRARIISAQLAQLTAVWDSYTSPRALALFSQLEQNLAYLETHRI